MQFHHVVLALSAVVVVASAQIYNQRTSDTRRDSNTRINDQIVGPPPGGVSGRLGSGSPSPCQGGGGTKHMNNVGISNVKFSSRLYSELSKHEGNLFFSPLSIHSILTMAYAGANGETATQMQHGLSLLQNLTQALKGYECLTNALSKQISRVTLDVANKIYTNKNVHINEDYLNKTRRVFQFQSEGTDFSAEVDSRRKINDWVAEKTHQNIKDLIPAGLLNADTLMVLVNAIYFRAFWLTKFEPKNTKAAIFTSHTNEEIRGVPMMNALSEFRYRDNWQESYKVLELLYEGEKVSMIILLPYEHNGLPALESKLATTDMKSLFESLEKTNVDVRLPKFTLEKSTDLDEALRSLGMIDMYSSAADFGKLIKNNEKVRVSKVAHKAFIEVSEEGTKAAAATFLLVQTLSLNSDEKADFNANHPFIYLVRHIPSNNIIFMGRFSNPQPQ